MVSNGSRNLAELAVKLKAAGDGGLRVQLLRGLRNGAKPLIPAVREAARAQLPKSGGLNEQVASQRVSVRNSLSPRTASVRLVTTAPDTQQTDQGFVRHPTFGRRGKGQWKRQPLPAATGWWTKTLERETPKVTAELMKVIKETSVALGGSV